jgi:hypothetical protein
MIDITGYVFDSQLQGTVEIFQAFTYHINDWIAYALVENYYRKARIIPIDIPCITLDATNTRRYAVYCDVSADPIQGGIIFRKAAVGEMLINFDDGDSIQITKVVRRYAHMLNV